METIKNLLRPGHKDDDHTLYDNQSTGGSTNTTSQSHSGGLTGEGSHLAGSTRDGTDVTSHSIGNKGTSAASHSSGLTGQGSHFGPSGDSQVTGNDSLGSTSTTTGRTGAGQREYDPSGNATTRGVTTLGGDNNQTYDSSQSTTVGPDSTANTASRTATSDNSRSTDLGGITGASSATHQGSQPYTTTHDSHVPSEGARDSTSGTANTTSRALDADGGRSTDLGGITGAASSTHGNHPPNTTSGPHQSDSLNRADPRVDSDNSRNTHSGVGGIATGTSNTHGSSQTNTTSGPHQSDTLNRLDPRVDSDNSKITGATGNTSGYSSTTGGSYHTGPIGSSVGGPHQTFTANALDPSLDNSSTSRREDAVKHYESQGGGAEQADNDHGTKARDVTAGAVGLGALGLGASNHESRFTNQGTSEVQREGHTLAGSTMPGTFPDSSASSTQHASTTSGIPDRTRDARDTTTTQDSKDHHYGRDAALAGGAAGLAGGAYGASHHSDNTHSSSTEQPVGSTIGDKLHGTEQNRGVGGSYPQSSTISSSAQPSSGGTTTTSHSQQTANTGSTTQPHSSSLLNKLDPRVSNEQTQAQDSHTGRNAALGAGALGAGGAAYGASRHHDDSNVAGTSGVGRDNATIGSTGQTAAPGSSILGTGSTTSRGHDNQTYSGGATNTAGPHSSDLANRADPRVDSDRSKEKDHSYGRDAALVGGAGAAGYGASRLHDDSTRGTGRDATKGTYSSDLSSRGANTTASSAPTHGTAHQTQQPHTSTTTTTTTNTSTTTAGPHSSDLLNRADPRVDSDRSKEKDHHYGRDAAIVGGAGTAAYGAHELSKDDEEKMRRLGEEERAKQQLEHEKFVEKEHGHGGHGKDAALVGGAGAAGYGAHELSKDEDEKMRRLGEEERAKQQREHEKFVEKDEKGTDKHEKKEHKGLFSFLHRDKNKKYTKEEEDDFDRQERDYDTQHGHGAGKKAAAATAAGAGAGTYAAHESHEHRTPVEDKARGSSIGDKLHGVHRNQGVPGDNPFPDGGGPRDGINEVTGQPFESSAVHGTHTIGTDGHHGVSGATSTTDSTGANQYGTTGNTTSGLTSGTTTGVTGHSATTDSSHNDRNRLHKDPPAGHPASQV